MDEAAPPCIFVVDDDTDIRETLVEVLEDHGCVAIGAPNGAVAMEKLHELPEGRRACLILLDLMMPVMDGRAFREEQLKEEALAQIPVVLISAYPSLVKDAQAMNVAGFLQKPLRLPEVLRTAHQFCACGGAAA